MTETLNIVAAKPVLTEDNSKRTRSGKWTLAQLRQTDGIVPLQSGTNKFDSQKGKTAFGAPRNTSTNVVFADEGKKYTIESNNSDGIVRLQSGTNKFDSQKGMTGFGAPRDVKGKHLKRIWELEFPEESPEHQFEQQRLVQMEQVKQQLGSPHHNGTNPPPSFGQTAPPPPAQQPQYQQKGYSNTQNRR
uniref:Uncharacterized protein n=1 Tax=Panagrolaimus sp. JU765 TaxID=591449 RepID=A0AC34QLP9_9BILA